MINNRRSTYLYAPLILFLSFCSTFKSHRNESKPIGLYMSIRNSKEYANQTPFFHFTKDKRVAYEWMPRKSESILVAEMKAVSVYSNYRIVGDSIFIEFDSLFGGYMKRTVKFKDRVIIDSLPAYHKSYKQTFRCRFSNGLLYCLGIQTNAVDGIQATRLDTFSLYSGVDLKGK
jgi:hypothetical protein